MNETELEELLQSLFENEDDEIAVLERGKPLFHMTTTCCTYSYAGLNG